MISPIFGSVITGVTSTTVSNYWFISSSFSETTASTTESLREIPFPNTFTVSNLYVQVQTAPGAGNSFTFTVVKNGVATALAVTISGTNNSGTDATDSIIFNAGDTISLQSTPGGTPTAPGNWYFNLTADSGSGNSYGCILGSNINGPSNVATNYTQLFGGNTATYDTTEANVECLIATAGTLSNMYVVLSASPGTSKSYAITVNQNGSGSALGPTISGANTTGSDTTDTISISAGDSVSIQTVPTGIPTSPRIGWGIQWNPTNNGESVYGFGNPVAPSTSVSNYEQVLGPGRGSYNATESLRPNVPGPYTITNFYVKIGTAPGGAANYAYTLRKNSGATALSVTVSGANTTGNITGQSVSFNQGDTLDLQVTPSSTPASTTGGVHTGFVIYIAPTGGANSLISFNPGQTWIRRFAANERHPYFITAATASIPATSTLQDDFKFDDGIDSYKWNNGGGGNIYVTNVGSEINHVLVLQSTLTSNYFDLTSINTYDLGGSYAFSQVYNAGNQAITSWEVYPVVIQDSIKSANQVWIRVSTGNVYAQQKINGVTTTQNSIAYSASTMQWFRIREQSGTTYWDYSADCVTWTNLASAANPMQYNTVQVTVQIGTWQNESSTTQAQIKNINVAPGSLQTTWSGYVWNRRVRLGASMYNHLFNQANISGPDSNGYLTLTITNPTGNNPYGAEIFTDNKNFGYGVYTFTIGTEVDNLDPNIVMGGAFLFDYQAPTSYNEIDIDEVRYYAGSPAQLLQSHAYAGPTFISNVGTVNAASQQTFRLIWGPDGMVFDAFVGPTASGTAYQSAYQTTHLPTPGNERIHINIWVQNVSNPSVVPQTSVVIQNFTYIPAQPTIGTSLPGPAWVRQFAKGERRTYLFSTPTVGGNVYSQIFTAMLSFTGSQTKQTNKGISGAASFSGSTTKATASGVLGTANLSFSGSQTKAITKGLPSATVSFTGAIAKQMGRPLAAALSSSGSITRSTAHHLTASVSFAGNIARNITRTAFTATLSFVGSITKGSAHFLTLTGSLSFVGASTRVVGKALSGAVSFNGGISRRTAKGLSASLSFVGSVTRSIRRGLAASVSFTGAAGRSIGKIVTGSLSFTGILPKSSHHNLSASVSMAGSSTKQTAKGMAASLTSSGKTTRTTKRALVGSLSSTGSVNRTTAKGMAASLSFAGAVSRIIAKGMSATVSTSGSLLSGIAHRMSLTGSLSFAGSISRSIAKSLTARMSFIGSVTSLLKSVIRPGTPTMLSQNDTTFTISQEDTSMTISNDDNSRTIL